MSNSDEIEIPITPEKTTGLRVVLISSLITVLILISIAATLYFTGFFNRHTTELNKFVVNTTSENPNSNKITNKVINEEILLNNDRVKLASEPIRIQKKSPDFVRFEYTYKLLDKELLSNLSGTKKVIMLQVAFMTSYDDRVFKNIDKHEFAIRGALLDRIRQYTEADTLKPEFRKELADDLKDAANSVLERYEDFGGIDAIHFTSFIIQ